MEDFIYNSYGMRAAGIEAAALLRRISGWLELLEKTRGQDVRSAASDLRTVCRGYDRLLLAMDGAARIYGAAEAMAEELAVQAAATDSGR